MEQVNPSSTRHKGLWATLAITAVTSATAVTIALPATSKADPVPAPPTTTAAPPAAAPAPAPPGAPGAPPAPPGDPNAAPPPPPVDPNAPPPPVVDPNAGRVTNAVGGFSFVLPPGWVESDASHLDYGSAMLSKTTGQPPMPGQPPPVANDTRVVLGRLDQKLYASAEANDAKAAVRLGSDMGEFFMPYPGMRINQDSTPLNANGISGSASYYEVKFSDAAKPNGQIWTGVIGSPGDQRRAAPALVCGVARDGERPGGQGRGQGARRVDPALEPGGGPGSRSGSSGSGCSGSRSTRSRGAPGAPAPAPAPGAPAPAPAPGQAPAGEVTPTPTPNTTAHLARLSRRSRG